MPWKNNNGDVSETRPTRVRLPESDTRTAEAVTDEVLAEAGWYWENPIIISEYSDPEIDNINVIADETSSGYVDNFTSTESFTVTGSEYE